MATRERIYRRQQDPKDAEGDFSFFIIISSLHISIRFRSHGWRRPQPPTDGLVTRDRLTGARAPSSRVWVRCCFSVHGEAGDTGGGGAQRKSLVFVRSPRQICTARWYINRTGHQYITFRFSEIHRRKRNVFLLATSPVQQRARDQEGLASRPWR